MQIEILSDSGNRMVKVIEQGGRFTSRLYVNGGDTATLVVAKASTFAGAMKQADRMLKASV